MNVIRLDGNGNIITNDKTIPVNQLVLHAGNILKDVTGSVIVDLDTKADKIDYYVKSEIETLVQDAANNAVSETSVTPSFVSEITDGESIFPLEYIISDYNTYRSSIFDVKVINGKAEFEEIYDSSLGIYYGKITVTPDDSQTADFVLTINLTMTEPGKLTSDVYTTTVNIVKKNLIPVKKYLTNKDTIAKHNVDTNFEVLTNDVKNIDVLDKTRSQLTSLMHLDPNKITVDVGDVLLSLDETFEVASYDLNYDKSSLSVNEFDRYSRRVNFITERKFYPDYLGSIIIIKNDTTLLVYGDNAYGQLCTGNTTTVTVPTEIDLVSLGMMSNTDKIKKVVSVGQTTGILISNGNLITVGSNTIGQLGDGTTTSTATLAVNLSGVKDFGISTGHSTIALKTDGTVWSTGGNGLGQLGLGDTNNVSTFTDTGLTGVEFLEVGTNSTYIVKTDGSLWSTGYNSVGQLGLGDTTNRSSFTDTGLTGVTDIVASRYSDSVAITIGNVVYTCGYNGYGQLGLGDFTNVSSFTSTGSSGEIVGFSEYVYGKGCLVIKDLTTNRLKVSGDFTYYRDLYYQDYWLDIGNIITSFADLTRFPVGKNNFINISLLIETPNENSISIYGYDKSIYLAIGGVDKTIYTELKGYDIYKYNYNYLSVTPVNNLNNTPVIVTTIDNKIKMVSDIYSTSIFNINSLKVIEECSNVLNFNIKINANNDNYIALQYKLFGINNLRNINIGDNLITSNGELIKVEDIKIGDKFTLTDIYPYILNRQYNDWFAVGPDHTTMMKSNGTDFVPYFSGYTVYGVYSNGDRTVFNTGVSDVFTDPVKQEANQYATYVLTNAGELYARGGDDAGAIGNGGTSSKTSYLLIANDVKDFSVGLHHLVIIRTDNTVWSTGANGGGQLGLGDTTSVNALTDTGFTGADFVHCGEYTTFIIKTDGTLWSTGSNGYGELGGGDTTDRTSFTDTGMTNVFNVSSGNNHTIIMRRNDNDSANELYATGRNHRNQLCIPDALVDKSSFTQILHTTLTNNTSNWAKVCCVEDGTIFLLNDGTIHVIGDNTSNNLILDNSIYSIVDTLTKVENLPIIGGITARYTNTFIMTLNGDVYACGRNEDGSLSLGNNDLFRKLDLSITGNNYVKLTGGRLYSAAYKPSNVKFGSKDLEIDNSVLVDNKLITTYKGFSNKETEYFLSYEDEVEIKVTPDNKLLTTSVDYTEHD